MTAPLRELFGVPPEVSFLNCAYLSPNALPVRAAGDAAIRREPWTVTAPDFFTDVERVRRLFAGLVGGDADGVALIPAVSYGVGVAAANCELAAGQKVLVLEDQFPSNVYPWREAVASTGAELSVVPRPADYDWTGAVLDAIDDRVAVVAVPNCHWTDGSLVDLIEVGAAARRVGAALVVDATQSLGAHPFDVTAVQPDFLVTAGYKWLLGAYGLGYLWAAPHRRAGTPLEFNWITREDAEDFAGLVDYRDAFQPGARRYDMGERSNFVLVAMAIAALELIHELGVTEIQAWAGGLTARAAEQAEHLGIATVPEKRRVAHLTGLRVPGASPEDLACRLAAAGVHVSVRGESVRVSAHVWNDAGDIDRLFAALAEV